MDTPYTDKISKQELRRQVEQELARRDLLHFTTYTNPAYKVDPVHRLIAGALTDLESRAPGQADRLMMFAPPQHGKSELTSVRFAAWWLGRNPDLPVAIISYGASLALDKSKQVRAIVRSDEFHELFPNVQIAKDSGAAEMWGLQGHAGLLNATGIDGAITGKGFGCLIIDDPHKDWAETQSPVMRRRVQEFIRGTMVTRLRQGGVIVLIMTRWNEDDAAGYLLREDQGYGDWRVLRLPALAETQAERDANNQFAGLLDQVGQADPLGREPGEVLAPQIFDLKTLLKKKREVGSVAWAAEYQGVPRAAEGNRFKREFFGIVDVAPAMAARVRYWDKAGSESDGACYTAGVLIARDKHGLFYVEDVVRARLTAYRREELILQTAQLDASKHNNSVKIWIEQEPGSGGLESAQNTVRMLAGYPIEADRPTGDKDTRLEPFAAQCEAGNVKLVKGLWNAAYIDEMISIPNGQYRDQGDATSGSFNKLCAQVKTPVFASPVAVVKRQDRPNTNPSGLKVSRSGMKGRNEY